MTERWAGSQVKRSFYGTHNGNNVDQFIMENGQGMQVGPVVCPPHHTHDCPWIGLSVIHDRARHHDHGHFGIL